MADPLDVLSAAERARAKRMAQPEWMQPMLAKLTHDHFSSPEWIYERKLDGERVITHINDGGDVTIMSRNRREINHSYSEVVEALAEQAPPGCWLDGEVVAFNKRGVSDFGLLAPRMRAGSLETSLASGVEVHYYLFDCMYIGGRDVTKLPLLARKRVLESALDWGGWVRFMEHREEEGEAFLREACASGWEGIIAKQADGEYIHGRSSLWLKFKCVRQQEFVIGGYTEPQGSRTGFGALLIGFYRDGDLVYAGKVGTGFDHETLEDLHRRMERLERKTSPFDVGDPPKDAHFVSPRLVCEVKFMEWTPGDHLRHPSYIGLRRDKDAKEVRKEE